MSTSYQPVFNFCKMESNFVAIDNQWSETLLPEGAFSLPFESSGVVLLSGRDVHFDRTLRNLTGESVWTVGSVMNVFLMEINALQFIQLYDVNSWTMHTCLF